MPSQPIRLAGPRATIQARLPDGRIVEAPPGTTLAEIMRAVQGDGPTVTAAVVNGKLRELTRALEADADVRPLTVRDVDGARIYRRSLVFLLLVAAEELFPESRVAVEHSASSAGGYYCSVIGRPPFNQAELDQIADRMRLIVAADEPFIRDSQPIEEAARLFRERGELDTVRLLAHRTKATVPIYSLRGHWDFPHGYLVPSTGYLERFALHASPPGFILQFPHQDRPDELTPLAPYPKLFAVFEEAGDWLNRLGIRDVGALNDEIAAGRTLGVSLVAEALHEARLARIAAGIAAERERVKVVLIAGPSASGKTTFAKRLAVQLLAHGGLRPFALGIDDYFLDREQTPRDANGQYDFESLQAVNVELFNRHLLALMDGAAVQLPHYNFITGQGEPGPNVRLAPGSIILVEGIHGLNPALVPDLPPECVYRIYISALTQLNLDRHNRVSTTDTRLIRRIVRDAGSRGYSAGDTLRRWESVKRGEKQNIFPFQENSDAIFNSALVHELAVLRPFAEPLLLHVRPDDPVYVEANRLLSFLQWFRPAPPDAVPDNSILQEFINPTGGVLRKLDLSKLLKMDGSEPQIPPG